MIDADPNNPLPPEPPEGPIPDELVDRFFDRELDDTGRAGFMRRLDADPRACERVAKTNRFLTLLKRGVRAPDQTDSILDRVDYLRGFVAPKERKLVRFGRLAVAAMLFGVIAGAVIVQRRAPEVVELAGMPTPVRDVARAAAKEADSLIRCASPAQFAGRAASDEAAVELQMWGPRHLDAQAQSVVSWSLSPVAACPPEETEASRALVLIGHRVIVIGDTADFKAPRASLAPITFGARAPLPSVRSSGFRDLP